MTSRDRFQAAREHAASGRIDAHALGLPLIYFYAFSTAAGLALIFSIPH